MPAMNVMGFNCWVYKENFKQPGDYIIELEIKTESDKKYSSFKNVRLLW